MVFRRRVVLLSPCLFLAILLTGCGLTPQTTAPTPVHAQYSGTVHGGQQPVAGAAIQLYTVGTTADGSAATPLLTSSVTSGADGTFTITGLYSCTNATQVYIVATGGNPGLSTANPNIALMAALGPCSSLTSSTFISINELTTVAAISALAPYMSSATAIGASSSEPPLANGATRIAAAFTVANQYVNIATGLSPGANLPSGVTVPTTELNTLADILSACINSAGGTAGDGSLCGNLFADTTIPPNAAPTDTIAAMLNIVDNPNLNTSALYALTPPTPPFQPSLTAAPADFLVSLQGAAIPEASPSVVDFQNVTVNTNSAVQTITIQNSATLGNVGIAGANSTDFFSVDTNPVQTGYCPKSSNSPSCWLQVEARPTATGVRNAFLAIDYNYGTSTIYVPLSVMGVASNTSPSVSSSIVNFPPTVTATSSTPVAVSISNSGPGTLTVSSITISGAVNNNFMQTNNCSSIAANANCTIYVTFAPMASGTQSATVQIATNASGSNTVSLSGTGVALGTSPSLWPSNLTFSIWGANEDLTLTNSGTASLSVGNPGVGDSGGSEDLHTYQISSNGCPATLAAGQACTFSVQNVLMMNLSASPLQPPPSGVTGQVFINPGTGEMTSNIITQSGPILLENGSQFTGNSVAGNMSFPSTSVGSSTTSTIQLTNFISQIVNGQPAYSLGGSPAASLAMGGANPGDFTVSAVTSSVSSTPASFCPGGAAPCNITIIFTPTASGTRTAKISLDANGSSTGQYIYVTGTATQ